MINAGQSGKTEDTMDNNNYNPNYNPENNPENAAFEGYNAQPFEGQAGPEMQTAIFDARGVQPGETLENADPTPGSEAFRSETGDGFIGQQPYDNTVYQPTTTNIIEDDPTDFGYERRVFDNSNYGYQQSAAKEETKKPKKSHGVATVIVSVLLSAAVAVGSCYAFLKYATDSKSGKNISILQGSSSDGTSVENVSINIDEQVSSIAQAVSRKCNKSVVGIRTTVSISSFFGGTNSSTGEGSGVIYSKDGYIITNYHVIKDAVSYSSGKIDVYLESVSTKPYSAKVIGYNIASDLAVLKIEANDLTPVQIGNSDKLSVGQYAITIGAPGGLEFMGSVTYGIISGLNRVVSTDSNIKLIQTDAAINPGNSGGALLDETGSLIGINSSKIVSEEFEGMGFAIPVNTVVKICDNIIANKDKAEPYVGITVSESYSAEDLKSYGYPAGAVVLSVAEGSTAETCGIRRGDIITQFNGKTISEYTDYYKALKACEPGKEVEIIIYRGGREYRASIMIASNSYSGGE